MRDIVKEWTIKIGGTVYRGKSQCQYNNPKEITQNNGTHNVSCMELSVWRISCLHKSSLRKNCITHSIYILFSLPIFTAKSETYRINFEIKQKLTNWKCAESWMPPVTLVIQFIVNRPLKVTLYLTSKLNPISDCFIEVNYAVPYQKQKEIGL